MLRDGEPFLKRPFDIFLSGIGLLLSAWLWALIWIMIVLEDGYPVFIKQIRVGKDGKHFTTLKFRSMKKTNSEEPNIQAHEDDLRVTGVGRILRKTALDELPQLLNIFQGNMSFVGPRPLLPLEVEVSGDDRYVKIENIPGFNQRITVRAGLTGLAQVYAPRDIPRRYKFKYDILYIKKMNFYLDLQLIFLSFLVTLTGRWEKRNRKLDILIKRKK